MYRILKTTIPIVLFLLADLTPAFAQDAAYQIVNRWRETVVAAAGQTAMEQPNNGLPTNQWIFENADEGSFRFRSVVSGGYLYFSGGALSVGSVPPTAREAMWRLEAVDAGHSRISNLARPDIYLHTQPEFLEASPMQPNWWSAMWRLEQVAISQATQQTNQNIQGANNGLARRDQSQSNQNASLPGGQQSLPGQVTSQGQSSNAYGKLPPPPRSTSNLTGPATRPAAQSVTLYIQNRSNADLDVFVDDDNGEQIFLATLRPSQQLQQTSPVGLVWRLAQGDVWMNAYQIEPGDAEQVIVFP